MHYRIDYSDYCGVDRAPWLAGRCGRSRPALANHYDGIAHTSVNRVQSEHFRSSLGTIKIDLANDHYTSALIPIIFLGRPNVADYSRKHHMKSS
jgi:hypothetical protein